MTTGYGMTESHVLSIWLPTLGDPSVLPARFPGGTRLGQAGAVDIRKLGRPGVPSPESHMTHQWQREIQAQSSPSWGMARGCVLLASPRLKSK